VLQTVQIIRAGKQILKSKTLLTIISLLVLSVIGLLTSCFREPVPYVFEGIMQPGIENAPPVEVFLDAELPVVPEKLPVYKIETVDDEYMSSLARRLGFDHQPGNPDDPNGPYTYFQDSDYQPRTKLADGIRYLELYRDGSLWLFTACAGKISSPPQNLPSFEEAKQIAADWLVSHDLYPANVTEVEKGGGLEVTGASGESTPYSIIVRFQTGLAGYNIYTSAASVEVGDNGAIIGANINMTQLKEYETVSIKTPEAALDVLKARLASPLADPPEARESVINLRSFEQLTVTRVTLQYTTGGGYLQPVYVFEGSAFSPSNPAPEIFKGKVDAVLRQKAFVAGK
jgi:hypothetical protein